jgi:hypothetical protein
MPSATLSATPCPESDRPGTPGLNRHIFFFFGKGIVYFNGFFFSKKTKYNFGNSIFGPILAFQGTVE